MLMMGLLMLLLRLTSAIAIVPIIAEVVGQIVTVDFLHDLLSIY